MPKIGDLKGTSQFSVDDVLNNNSIKTNEKIKFLQSIIDSLSETPTNMQAWELPEDYESQWNKPSPSSNPTASTFPRTDSSTMRKDLPTNRGAWESNSDFNYWMNR